MPKRFPDSDPSVPDSPVRTSELHRGERIVHIGGEVPLIPIGPVPDAFDEQVRVSWREVERRLASTGATLEDLVSHTVVLRSFALQDEYLEVCGELLGLSAASSGLILIRIHDEPWSLRITALAVVRTDSKRDR